ncbi:uncharacterized protein LOC135205966 [Macrobrachium nipponense]|uniref:uncharacterized protein LOC135205966 n=1 Tax=Macrobrachium nipponense TaxID=159736 RepID=UPI0030C7D323
MTRHLPLSEEEEEEEEELLYLEVRNFSCELESELENMETPKASLIHMSPSEKRQYRLQRETHLLEDVVKYKTERLLILKAENDRLKLRLRGKIERAYNALETASKTTDQGAATAENGSETAEQGPVSAENGSEATTSNQEASRGRAAPSARRDLLGHTGVRPSRS